MHTLGFKQFMGFFLERLLLMHLYIREHCKINILLFDAELLCAELPITATRCVDLQRVVELLYHSRSVKDASTN